MSAEEAWKTWWEAEGKHMKRLPHHNAMDYMASVTRIAWLNGAFGAADEIERLRAEIDRKNLTIQALTEERDEVVRMANKLTAERDEARRRMNSILTEIDCRIEHGAESNGHLEVLHDMFKENTDE